MKKLIVHLICRIASNLINEMHGFQHQAEPDAMHALRNSITKYQLQRRSDIENMIDERIAKAKAETIVQIQSDMCDGMNIDYDPIVSLSDLFALIDTSISRRITGSAELSGSIFPLSESDKVKLDIHLRKVASGRTKVFGGKK